MSLNKKAIAFFLICIVFNAILFLVGIMFLSKYLYFEEMQNYESVILNNHRILASCGIHECHKDVKEFIHSQNKDSIEFYKIFEQAYQANYVADIPGAISMAVLVIWFYRHPITPSETLQKILSDDPDNPDPKFPSPDTDSSNRCANQYSLMYTNAIKECVNECPIPFPEYTGPCMPQISGNVASELQCTLFWCLNKMQIYSGHYVS